MKPYYEIGEKYIYPRDERVYTLIGTSKEQCNGDGQESCAICKGKMIFEDSEGKQITKCPYTYNEASRDWVPYFIKVSEGPLLTFHGEKK